MILQSDASDSSQPAPAACPLITATVIIGKASQRFISRWHFWIVARRLSQPWFTMLRSLPP